MISGRTGRLFSATAQGQLQGALGGFFFFVFCENQDHSFTAERFIAAGGLKGSSIVKCNS